MDFKQIQREVKEWSKKNFGEGNPHRALLGVVEEVGELSHAHLKMEQGIRGSNLELFKEKVDAVGDIVIYLADYCERNDINFEFAVSAAWREVQKRDWNKNKVDGSVIC